MKDLIWKKHGKGESIDQEVMAFLAGEDIELDRQLLLFDLRASAAHVRGLEQIGIVSEAECGLLSKGLKQIEMDVRNGVRQLDSQFEDCHSAIESWLGEMLGEVAGKVHTGRSRNDQVVVALRLYMKDRLLQLQEICIGIAEVLLHRVDEEGDLPMAGYTHLQPAMPSSAGLWLAGHAEAFIDNAELAGLTLHWLDASPLGTASGFGVNLDLPRDAVATELGFRRLVVNPQYAQNSRGKIELQALSALAASTLDLRRLAWDLSLFVTHEFGFVKLAEKYCTGSSIMPNKRNPDTIELLRAVHGVVQGAQMELSSMLSLPSGYQRDLQATKPPLMRAFGKGLQALALMPELLATFQWCEERMLRSVSVQMLATDRALDMANEGLPFREAYRRVAADMEDGDTEGVQKSVLNRISPGACGNLDTNLLQDRIKTILNHPD